MSTPVAVLLRAWRAAAAAGWCRTARRILRGRRLERLRAAHAAAAAADDVLRPGRARIRVRRARVLPAGECHGVV